MAELRTLVMRVNATLNEEVWVEHLFEKAIRIKKIQMMVANNAVTSSTITGYLTKHKIMPVHDGVGHLAYMQSFISFVTSGMAETANHMVIDFGADYVEVEEDGFLYLGCLSALASPGWVVAIIFYEE